jgi:APA family basic amino acid/polyamine antiporter
VSEREPFWSAFRRRYLLRKPVAAMRRQIEESRLAKTLGVWELTALGIGGIIGAGIYTTTGFITSIYTGPAVAVSFLLAAGACALAGLAYAEMSAMLPLGGSAYTYAYASFGELVAWVLGWALVLEYAIGNMAVASGFSGNFSSLVDRLGAGFLVPQPLRAAPGALPGVTTWFDLPAFLIVMLITVLLLRPVRESARTNLILVLTKIAILVVFLAVALPDVKTSNLSPFAPFGALGVLAGASLIFFSFIGFDTVSTAAEETREPQRDVPRGILLSLAVCTVFYILVGLALTGVVSYTQLNARDPLALALDTVGHGNLAGVMNVGGILATVSVLLVFQLGTSRIFLNLARDGLIPRWFVRISPKHRTPTRITIASGLFVGLFAALLPLTLLVNLTNIGTLFAFVVVLAGLLVLRRREPDLPRPFRMPGSPFLPWLGIAACGALVVALIAFTRNGTLTLLGFVGWMGLGLMIYASYGAPRSRLRRGEVVLEESLEEAEARGEPS